MSTDVQHALAQERLPGGSFSARLAVGRGRLAGAQKPNAAVPAYLRYVNRKAGGRLACLGFAARCTPSQVSLMSAAVSLAGMLIMALAPANVLVGILVSAALALGYALDSADGQLARIRGGGTVAGEWLDHVLDIAKTIVLHGCVLITLYRHFAIDARWLLVPLAFLLAQVTAFFATMLRDALRMQAGLSRRPPSVHASFRSSLVLLPVDYGTLCWTFALLGWHDGFLALYTALAAIAVLFGVRALARSHRGLVALDAGSAV